MSKRSAQANARIESGFCSFCNRTRNLRHEEKRLGAIVRTVVTCETCRRTISSTMGLAGNAPDPAVAEPAPERAPEPAPEPAEQGPKERPAAKAAAPRTRARRKV